MSGPAGPVPAGSTYTLPVADLDRRFYAFAIDRAVALLCYGLGAWLTWWLAGDRWAVLLGVLAGIGLLLVTATAALLAHSGATLGKRLMDLRVLDQASAGPLRFGAAWWRTVLLGLAGLPTLGFGVAALAWTALVDPSGRRRGWHDLRSGAVVVDVRPVPEPLGEVVDQPRQVVNLTALRLAPVTTPGPVRPAAPAPTRPPGPSGPPASPDGRTVVRGAPLAPAAPPPPAVPTPAWRLTFDHGESLLVEGVVLVGRRPQPRAGEVVRHLVPLASSDMSVSKTHAQLGPAPDGTLVVVDRGSTNGSLLLRQGVVRELPPGKPATLVAGDRLRFGDREVVVSRDG